LLDRCGVAAPLCALLQKGSFNGPRQNCGSQHCITYFGYNYSDWHLLLQHCRCDDADGCRIFDGSVRARRRRSWRRWRSWRRRRPWWWRPWSRRRWSWRWSRFRTWRWSRLRLRSWLWLWRRLLCGARLLLGWPRSDLPVTPAFRRTYICENGAVCEGILHHYLLIFAVAPDAAYRGSVVDPIRY